MKKIFLIIMLMFLISISSASATINWNTQIVSDTPLWNYSTGVTGLLDLSRSKNNGTATGTTYNTGKDAFEFDAVTEKIVLDNEPEYDFDITDEFSISFWAKKNAYATSFYVCKQLYSGAYTGYCIWQNGNNLEVDLVQSLTHRYVNTFDVSNITGFFNVVVVNEVGGASPNISIYINGTEKSLITVTNSLLITDSILNVIDIEIGNRNGAFNFNGNLSDVIVYNKSLTPTEASSLFSLGRNINPYIAPSYEITTYQYPENITVESVGNLTINASIYDSVGGIEFLLNPYSILNFNVVNEGNKNCTIIYGYNNSCIQVDYGYNMTKINNSYYSYIQDENEYFPSYYPFTEEWVEQVSKSDFELINSNAFKYEVRNLTNDSSVAVYIEYNIDYQSLLFTDPLFVKFCFYNYTTGNILFGDTCRTIDVLPVGTDFDHCHTANSCHHVTRIPPDIILENNNNSGYIAFGSTATVNQARWNSRYSTNATYSSGYLVFQTSGDNGLSWSNTSNIFDVHLHQFKNTDGINYSVTFYDGDGNYNISESVYDKFDILNSAPTNVNILKPDIGSTVTVNSTGVNIYFNWTNSTDADNDTIYYAVALGNGLPTINLTSGLTNSSYNTSLTSSQVSNGVYRTYVYSYDSAGARSISPDNGTFTICVSSWVATLGTCSNNIQNVTYADSNSCPVEYDRPANYNQNCTVGDSSQWILIVLLIFMMSVLIALAFLIHPLFLGIAGLLLGVLTPITLMDIVGDVLFLILLFIISGLFILVSFIMSLNIKNKE